MAESGAPFNNNELHECSYYAILFLMADTSKVNYEWRGKVLYRRARSAPVAEIVPDEKWPSMWRVRLPDGTLSDMVNLIRAKDAAVTLAGKAL